jgi:hypothetical protein
MREKYANLGKGGREKISSTVALLYFQGIHPKTASGCLNTVFSYAYIIYDKV